MEKQRARHFYDDLCGIYQQEISSLSAEIETLRQKNHELQLQHQAEIAANKKENEAMHMKLQELTSVFKTAETTAQETGAETDSCSPTVEGLLQQLEAEELKVTAELSVTKQQLTDLIQQLEAEKHLRMQVEADKLEAVEIADILFGAIEDMKKESLAQLRSEKSKQDQLHLEILKLKQGLQREEELRLLAEADAFTCHGNMEFTCQLQTEKKLRMEAERSRLEAVRVSMALYQSLEKVLTMTEKLAAEIQTLTGRLRQVGKHQDAVAEGIMELTLTVEREMALRAQSERYELEAYEVVETLQKQIRRLRKMNAARTWTPCWSRRRVPL